jgi:hypothetical protein
MGNTLHNKIHLGRHPLLNSRRFQVALGLGACAGIALALALARALR